MPEHDDKQNGKHPHEEYDIVVNGTAEIVDDELVSYEQAVAFAYPNPDPRLEFSVAYRKAIGPNAGTGTLAPGQSVRVHKKGTTFNVTPTVKS